MEVCAYAKVNLYLDVTGRRPDGYHELISLVCGIDLADTLRLQLNAGKDRVTCLHPDVPEDASNLALKAARRFFEAAGRDGHVDIVIEKRIPVGAGLGGGSSDAAAVLAALNTRFGRPLSHGTLLSIGRRIGADVPFFINGGPALAEGIGERLTPWPHLPANPLVLIYPGKPVSTAEVYRNLNLGLTGTPKISKRNIFRQLRENETDVCQLMYNALEPPAIALFPEIADAKQALMDSGADAALMSGSGSSVFGVFPDWHSAKKAYADIRQASRHWQVHITRFRAG
jgi:4-diphosphocytidyl-2-C-methyl-D-erythritol kinase